MSELQKLILDDSTTTKVLSACLSFVTCERDKYQLLHIIEDISDIRINKTRDLAELCIKLSENINGFGDIIHEQFKINIFTNPIYYHSELAHPYFYRCLYDLGFIKLKEIEDNYDQNFDFSYFHLQIILHFGDLIKWANQLFLNQVKQYIPSEYDQKIHDIIRKDDLEDFYQLQEDPLFNHNLKIVILPLNTKYFFTQRNVSLINLAAFYSSSKIFKFLYIQPEIDLELTAEFSVAGGNIEIIRLLEQKNCDLSNCFGIAVSFYNYEVASWLKDSFNFVSNDVITNNYDENIEMSNNTLLETIDQGNSTFFIQYSERKGFKYDDPFINQAIFTSAKSKSRDIFEYIVLSCDHMLQNGSFPNNGNALFYSITLEYVDSIRFILANNIIDQTLKTADGYTYQDIASLISNDTIKSIFNVQESLAITPKPFFPGCVFTTGNNSYDQRDRDENSQFYNEDDKINYKLMSTSQAPMRAHMMAVFSHNGKFLVPGKSFKDHGITTGSVIEFKYRRIFL